MQTILRSRTSAKERTNAEEELRAEVLALKAELEAQTLKRTEAEAQNRSNLHRLRAVLENLPMGAAIIDGSQRIVQLNQKLCEAWNVAQKAGDWTGKPWEEFRAHILAQIADVAEYEEYVRRFHDTHVAQIGTETALCDGRMIIRDKIPIVIDGGLEGCLVLHRDVTRDRRLDRSKSEFMSLVSHQLRTPLTVLKWSYSRLAQSLTGRLDEFQTHLLDESRAAADRMTHTINTMLAISRIEAGTVHPEIIELKLGKALNDVRVGLREAYERKKQVVRIDCPNNIVLHTDSHILAEIVNNLLANAIKYTPEGGEISLIALPREDDVVLEVRDTGCGIPEEEQHKVFQKFFRAANVIQEDTEGTGLGLYLVSLLVAMLHGKITFLSKAGKGTTFIVTIPSRLHAAN